MRFFYKKIFYFTKFLKNIKNKFHFVLNLIFFLSENKNNWRKKKGTFIMTKTKNEKLMVEKEKRVVKLIKERKFKLLDISSLVLQKGCKVLSTTDLDLVQNELYTNGVLSPISVIGPYEDGTYKVVDGARRLNALLTMKKITKVPCYIVHDKYISDKEARLLAISANKVQRTDTVAINMMYAEMYAEECIAGRLDYKSYCVALKETINVSTRMCRQYQKVVFNASEKMIALVKERKISLFNAYTIVNNISNPKEQDKTAKEFLKLTVPSEKKEFMLKVQGIDPADFEKIKAEKTKKRLNSVVRSTRKNLSVILENIDKIDPAEAEQICEICKDFISMYA